MARHGLFWAVLALVLTGPLALAAASPLLAWRDPIYIAAGFAGVVAMSLLLVQPLLAGGLVPGMSAASGRRLHRFVGAALLCCVIAHVAGLWVTSPPDVLDALLMRSPTPFAVWGVVAMWAMFATALLALLRRPLRLRWRSWRIGHSALASVIVVGSVVHAVLIEGTMEVVSKWGICALVVIATVRVLADRSVLARLR